MKCQCSISSSSSSSGVDERSVFSLTSSSKYEVDYLGEKTKGDLNVKVEHLKAFRIDSQTTLKGPIEEVAKIEAEEAEDLLRDLVDILLIICLCAIGYDMDYTMMHDNVIA
ncbi:hypothetical protein L3X38_001950 [Prunus dulcis]|uniref:Uncharacterized protein n=1 Tax=Prunus dulcis TaxID=3755 RepID=A0AAD4WTJ2_PRUDU|nr:hypothetical protein L3X38_001950 [Prunus dulcis]